VNVTERTSVAQVAVEAELRRVQPR
jgi:hypothetical protein